MRLTCKCLNVSVSGGKVTTFVAIEALEPGSKMEHYAMQAHNSFAPIAISEVTPRPTTDTHTTYTREQRLTQKTHGR